MADDRGGWDEPPPPHLYGRVTEGLRARGLMRSRGWPMAKPLGLAAALLLAFLSGRLSTRQAGESQSQQPSYALFLMASATVHYPDSLTHPDVVNLYRRWAERLAVAGRLTLGEELLPRRYAVDRAGSRESPIEGGVDGMFVVRAPSADSALALAGTLPHVQFGGTVMVQEVARR